MSSDTEHIEWLQEKLETYESKLLKAENTVARLRPLVLNLRGVIESLRQEQLGQSPPKTLFGDVPPTSNGHQPDSTCPAGNKNNGMPKRRPEYEQGSLLDAAQELLDNAPGPLHADDVTRGIYIIETVDQFARAKHSMVSELIRGVQRQRWDKVGPNLFKSKAIR